MTTPTQQEPTIRYRVNVTRLAKGAFSFDCTCELQAPIDMINGSTGPVPSQIDLGVLREQVLKESQLLVEVLKIEYPLSLE